MIQNQYIFAQITTTKPYYYFILLQLLLTLFLTACIYVQSSYIFILECTLASLLSIDILIKYFAYGKEQFAKSLGNKIDGIIIITLLLLILIEALFENEPNFQQFSSFLLFIRYGVQLYRAGRLMKQSNQSRLVQSLQPISLDIDVENVEEKLH